MRRVQATGHAGSWGMYECKGGVRVPGSGTASLSPYPSEEGNVGPVHHHLTQSSELGLGLSWPPPIYTRGEDPDPCLEVTEWGESERPSETPGKRSGLSHSYGGAGKEGKVRGVAGGREPSELQNMPSPLPSRCLVSP